jgi:hypothetical protein
MIVDMLETRVPPAERENGSKPPFFCRQSANKSTTVHVEAISKMAKS